MKYIILKQKEYFNENTTKSIDFRKKMLIKLLNNIIKHETEIYLALKKDLNKSETESYLTEIQIVKSEINSAIKNINKWSKPKKVKTPLTHFPSKSYIYNEPFGTVLILSPWNYPFQLALNPLVGAIVAGNCACLKISNDSKHTAEIVKKIIDETFEKNYIYYIEDKYSYEEILQQEYDFIFFTGSQRVGRIIMEAAIRNLTPVILELGGKSPCIIDENTNVDLAAKRIIWGKFLNSGQTCVAPDYVLIHKNIEKEFIKKCQYYINLMYKDALNNPSYPKIINQKHFERLTILIKNYDNIIGGKSDVDSLKIEPTLFLNVNFSDEIMEQEIFGPILPIISYDDISQTISKLKSLPKPLALYIFSDHKELINKINSNLSFGGGCVNDTILHITNHKLPFGGVGYSGMGNYHGKYSFETFSHKKSLLENKNKMDMALRYPPYSKGKLDFIKKINK